MKKLKLKLADKMIPPPTEEVHYNVTTSWNIFNSTDLNRVIGYLQ